MSSSFLSSISGLMGLEEVTGVMIIQKNGDLLDLTDINILTITDAGRIKNLIGLKGFHILIPIVECESSF